jgi:hypothetical protein
MPGGRLSYIGNSDRKMDAMVLSMKLHVRYLLSLEDSPRTRAALLRYIDTWAPCFYPGREDIFRELADMADSLGGTFQRPKLRRKYRWLAPILGEGRAWKCSVAAAYWKSRMTSNLEKVRGRSATVGVLSG